MSDQILINGIAYSWGSVLFKIFGEPYHGITSIAFSDKIETAKAWGMGKAQQPRARSRGKYVPEQLVTKVQNDTAEEIRTVLAEKGPDGVSYGMTEAPIVLQYLERGLTPILIEFDRCRLVEDGSSDEEGADVLTTEIKWDIMAIRRNGKTLFQQRR